MKATGIVRRIDDIGRVCIPKEIRNSLGLKANDTMDIYVEKDEDCSRVIFEKYEPLDEAAEQAKKAAAFVRTQVQEHERITFYFNGEFTTCNIWDNCVGTEGIAVCSPDDIFDPNIGMAVALCHAHGWASDYWLTGKE